MSYSEKNKALYERQKKTQAFHNICIVVAGMELNKLNLFLLLCRKLVIIIIITITDYIGGDLLCKIGFAGPGSATED